jgi:hypothetical protein
MHIKIQGDGDTDMGVWNTEHQILVRLAQRGTRSNAEGTGGQMRE